MTKETFSTEDINVEFVTEAVKGLEGMSYYEQVQKSKEMFSNWRSVGGMSIEELVAAKEAIDSQVGELVDAIRAVARQVECEYTDNYQRLGGLDSLADSVIESYGDDSYHYDI